MWDTVSRWENGRSVPPVSKLKAIAAATGLPVKMFAEGGPTPARLLQNRKKAPSKGADVEAVYRSFQGVAGRYLSEGKDIPVSEALSWMDRLKEACLSRV